MPEAHQAAFRSPMVVRWTSGPRPSQITQLAQERRPAVSVWLALVDRKATVDQFDERLVAVCRQGDLDRGRAGWNRLATGDPYAETAAESC